jgi:hypothetical protein
MPPDTLSVARFFDSFSKPKYVILKRLIRVIGVFQMPTTTTQACRSSGISLASRLCKWVPHIGRRGRPIVPNGILPHHFSRWLATLESERLLQLARRQTLIVPSVYSLAEGTPISRVLDAVSAAGQRQLYRCCKVVAAIFGIDPWRRHHCRSVACASMSFFSMQVFFLRLSVLVSKTCLPSNTLRVEATRLDIRYTAAILLFLPSEPPRCSASDLGPKASRLCCLLCPSSCRLSSWRRPFLIHNLVADS